MVAKSHDEPQHPDTIAQQRIEEQLVFEGLRSGSAWQPRSSGLLSRRNSLQEEGTEDLPCPWCHADTDEGDPRCPTCGRRFG